MSFNRKGNLDSVSIIDYNSFKYYRSNSKKRNLDNTSNYVEHGKILSLFYKKIGEKIIESTGGVFIEKLGYFSGIVAAEKKYSSYFNGKINLNRSTSGYSFHLIFVPISKDNYIREWVADSSFSTSIKKRFSEKLKLGTIYTFNPSYFIDKYGRKNNNYEY